MANIQVLDKGEKDVSWSTKSVEEILEKFEIGIKPKHTPFYKNDINLRDADIVFEYTPEELAEIKKCKKDILYFADKYCYAMTDSGIQNIKLREYQRRMLKHMQDNRYTVVLACRQIGKCLIFGEINTPTRKYTINELYDSVVRDRTFLHKVKMLLYKLIERIENGKGLIHTIFKKTKNITLNILYMLIELIESYEYRHLSLDEDDINKKIIDTIDISDKGITVQTEDGYKPITHIHKTQPYHVYRLVLENGMHLTCADNHIVFCDGMVQKFVKDLTTDDYVMVDGGVSRVKSVTRSKYKVSMYDVTVDSYSHSYYSNGILSHNTICSCIFILWYAIFNYDKNTMLVSNKGATTKEIIDKLKVMLENLPFFMKPGIVKYDQMSVIFDNKCRIQGQSTSKRSGIGFTINMLYMDEFAHIQDSVVREMYDNIYPTLSSLKGSRCVITSTPNGFNKYYEIYHSAEIGENEYAPFRVDWWEVPGRDEEWRKRELANLGSVDAFNMMYGNSFLSSSMLLLTPETLNKLTARSETFVHREIPEFDAELLDYNDMLWAKDFDLDELTDPYNLFLASIDIAEGKGGKDPDNSVINLFKLEVRPREEWKYVVRPHSYTDFFRLRQVGMFASSKHTLWDFASLVYTLVFDVMNPEHVRMVIEYNTFGGEFMDKLKMVFPERNDFAGFTVLKYKHRIDAKKPEYGLRLKSDNKRTVCENAKKCLSTDRLLITELFTCNEFKLFSKLDNGTYKAQSGHDDRCMSTINAGTFFEHPTFTDMCDEMFQYIDPQMAQEIEDLVDAERDKNPKNNNGTMYDFLNNM